MKSAAKTNAERDKAHDASVKASQKKIATAYKAAYTRTLTKLERLWSSIAKGDGKSFTRKETAKIIATLDAIKKDYAKLVGGSLENVKESTIRSYLDGRYGTEYSILKTTGANIQFGKASARAVSASVNGGKVDLVKTAKKSSVDVMDKLKRVVTEALIDGEALDSIADRIQGAFNNGYNDAIRVLRTETHRAYNEANLESIAYAESLGTKIIKVWRTSIDGRERETHADMDGQEADENGMFYSPDGGETEAPGLFDIPEEDINCRCTMLEYIDNADFEGEILDIADVPDYDTWVEGYMDEYASVQIT